MKKDTALDRSASEQADRLDEILDSFPRLLVAYSGGVDSACLLKAAHQRLGSRVLGMIADSPSLPRAELTDALLLAKRIGVQVEVAHTGEFSNPDYLANSPNRCYFCKHELFEKMEMLARERGFSVLAYGENADDTGEIRPGARAAVKFQVRAPLREAGLTKADVRALSAKWGLPTADKAASPCLSSRIPHGTPVSIEALARIEAAEAAVRCLGFRIFRLRHHGDCARLEFAPDDLTRAMSNNWQPRIARAVLATGYREVEFDPHGYRGKNGLR